MDKRKNNLIQETLVHLWEMCANEVPGIHQFVAMLNEGRVKKKRKSEFRVDKVVQAFDKAKFNFEKVLLNEVLFEFDVSSSIDAPLVEEEAVVSKSPNLVMINVNPIEYGHVLLVPRVLDRLPQLMTPEALRLGIRFIAAVNNPCFRLNYNSFGAFASVNHLHFQGYFLMAPYPIERAPAEFIASLNSHHVNISELIQYPVHCWSFEMTASFDLSAPGMEASISVVCSYLQGRGIPFNLVMSDCGARIFVCPQQFGEKLSRGLLSREILETEVIPAVSEIAGHFISKKRRDYNSLTDYNINALLSEASLSDQQFSQLTTDFLPFLTS